MNIFLFLFSPYYFPQILEDDSLPQTIQWNSIQTLDNISQFLTSNQLKDFPNINNPNNKNNNNNMISSDLSNISATITTYLHSLSTSAPNMSKLELIPTCNRIYNILANYLQQLETAIEPTGM